MKVISLAILQEVIENIKDPCVWVLLRPLTVHPFIHEKKTKNASFLLGKTEFYSATGPWAFFLVVFRSFDHLSVNRNALLGIPLFEFFDFRVLSFFYRLVKFEWPGYFFSIWLGLALLVRPIFLLPGVCSAWSVLARGIRLCNRLLFGIKDSRPVTGVWPGLTFIFSFLFLYFFLLSYPTCFDRYILD
jgi:hypothetical protein